MTWVQLNGSQPSSKSTTLLNEAIMDATELLLNAFVIFGMCCVFATFGFMMPVVGQTVATLFIAVFGEQAVARMRGKSSGCEMTFDEPSSDG